MPVAGSPPLETNHLDRHLFELHLRSAPPRWLLGMPQVCTASPDDNFALLSTFLLCFLLFWPQSQYFHTKSM